MGLVDQGAEVNTPNLARYYPLYVACLNGRIKVTDLRLSLSALKIFTVLMVIIFVILVLACVVGRQSRRQLEISQGETLGKFHRVLIIRAWDAWLTHVVAAGRDTTTWRRA